MTDEGSQERRARTRVGYKGSVELIHGDGLPARAVIRDISINGLFVETEAELTEGQSCRVVVHLGQTADIFLTVQGRVSRVGEGGLGIAFESIDPDSFDHLRKLVLYNSPQPDRIENEFKKPGLK
jgi:hypothetical protein